MKSLATGSLSPRSIGLGIAFFVMFWQVFDSLALGIGLGVAMAAAFSAEEKEHDKKAKPDEPDSRQYD